MSKVHDRRQEPVGEHQPVFVARSHSPLTGYALAAYFPGT